MTFRPTLYMRLTRWMGYRYRLGEEPQDPPTAGWMRTDIRFRFGWMDRLRLLTTGRMSVISIVYMDTPSPINSVSRVDFRILAPGDHDWY